jgi:hypothetical protein
MPNNNPAVLIQELDAIIQYFASNQLKIRGKLERAKSKIFPNEIIDNNKIIHSANQLKDKLATDPLTPSAITEANQWLEEFNDIDFKNIYCERGANSGHKEYIHLRLNLICLTRINDNFFENLYFSHFFLKYDAELLVKGQIDISLNLSGNQLTSIPDDIPPFFTKNLRELDLNNNNFTGFPPNLKKFKNWETLLIQRDPIIKPSDDVWLPAVENLPLEEKHYEQLPDKRLRSNQRQLPLVHEPNYMDTLPFLAFITFFAIIIGRSFSDKFEQQYQDSYFLSKHSWAAMLAIYLYIRLNATEENINLNAGTALQKSVVAYVDGAAPEDKDFQKILDNPTSKAALKDGYNEDIYQSLVPGYLWFKSRQPNHEAYELGRAIKKHVSHGNDQDLVERLKKLVLN